MSVDGKEVEKFVNETLQGYVDAGKEMLVYNGSAVEHQAFTVENVKAYLETCLVQEDGTPYVPGSDYQDELYYVGYKTSEYLQYFDSTSDSIGEANALIEGNNAKAGASYVISFDIKHYGNYSITPIELRSYATDSGNVPFQTLKIEKDGTLNYCYETRNGAYQYKSTGKVLAKGEWAQIAFWHTPRGIDGIRGTADDNTYHIFLNGEYLLTETAVRDVVKADGSVANDYLKDYTYNAKTYNTGSDYTACMVRFGQFNYDNEVVAIDDFRIYYGAPVECTHVWSYSHKHDASTGTSVLAASCAWCGKTESKELINFELGEFDLTNSELADKFTENHQVITNTELSIDATKQIESQSPYGLTYNNGWFAKQGSTVIINWRKIVKATDKDGNEYIKWQRPIVYGPDNNYLDLSINEETEKFNNEKLQSYVGKAITYYNSTGNTTDTVTFESAAAIKAEFEKFISVENGIPYYKGYMTNEYLQYLKFGDNQQYFGLISQHKDSVYVGGAYTVTLDYYNINNSSSKNVDLFELSSYSPLGDTKNPIPTVTIDSTGKQTWSKTNSRASEYPISIKPDGTILYKDYGSTKTLSTDIASIPNGTWTQLTFYHTPRGLDGVRGTDDDNTYHIFVNGKHVITAHFLANKYNTDFTTENFPEGIKVKDPINNTWVELKGGAQKITYNPATDYVCSMVRVAQSSDYADLMGLDDVKIYYGAPIECTHVDKNGTSTVKNGVCTWCKATVTCHCDICERDVQFSGIALGKDVAITDRNVELGDEISMNVYLELSEAAKADESTLVRLTGADGDKVAEYALADLTESEKAPGRYKATLPLRSIDMTSEVKVELVKGGEAYGTAYTTSVSEYLEALLKTDGQSDEAVALAKATLNYGAYAQLYFAEHNENPELAKNLANAALTEADRNAIAAVTTDNLADYRISLDEEKEQGEGVQVTGASLILTSQTKMKLYFTASSAATVKVGDKALTKYASENDGEYYVLIDGVNPAGLDEEVTLTITDGDNASTVSLSVLSCVDAILYAGDAMPETLTNLAKAIYLYNVAADAYQSAA